jgi:transposase-like protein
MPRLTAEQWERARAEYEVRGVSLKSIAKKYGITLPAVSARAKAQGWTQGKTKPLADRKVAAIKELIAVEEETKPLPLVQKYTLDTVVREQLEESAAVAALGRAIANKGLEILKKVESPLEWETMTRGKRNLAPPPAPAKGGDTTVNVQATAQSQAAALPPPQEMPEVVDTLRKALSGGFAE